MNLLTIQVGHTDDIPGFTAGFYSHQHNENHEPFWRTQGYDGVHLVGRGNTITAGLLRNTLMFGRGCGHVKLSNFTIQAGSRRAIFAGPDALDRDDLVPFHLELVDCDIIAEDHTVWGIHSYACDITVFGGEWDLEASHEHGLYTHGFSASGACITDLTIKGVGAEGLKFTGRPRTEFYPPGFDIVGRAPHHQADGVHPTVGASIQVRNCDIRNWHQPHSWRGGAGMTVQGAGADVLIQNSLFRARDGDYKPCLAVDDSGWEHFSPSGVGGEAPANGRILVNHCLFHTAGRVHDWGDSWQPIMRFAQSSSDPARATGPVARSIAINNSGVYGHLTRLEIATMPENRVFVSNCNTSTSRDEASSWGVDPTHESHLQVFGNFLPISQGYTPTIDI